MAIEYRDQRKSPPTVSEDGTSLTGRAVPFDQETQIGAESWGFKEKINRSAANKTLKEEDTALLDQHDSHKPIARASAGTLTLTKRNGGLEWDAEPTSKASYIADALENVRAGNYGGCSIGFEVVRDKWTDDKGEESDRYEGTHREVLELKLHEVSLVTFPAYKDTNVQHNDAGILGERRAAYEAAQNSLEDERREAAEEEENAEPEESEQDSDDERDDPDGKEYAAIDGAVRRLTKSPPDVAGALKVLKANQKNRDSEPVTTTREDDEYETALRIAKYRENQSRMSDLG